MPEVSVIVCTYNRDKFIKRTLECLRDQTADSDVYEVLIIDNNSTDNTPLICKNFLSETGSGNFHYFLEKDQGHTFARNRGIHEADGEILAFIDDDAFVHKEYVSNISKSFESHSEAIALGGKIIPIYESGREPAWMSRFLLPLVAALDMGEEVKKFRKSKFPIGANMAFRKVVFEKYGLFDVRLGRRGADGLEGGDEKDVFHRLNMDGQVIIYDPGVKVDHIIPEKRVEKPYVKALAIGVGTSERKRLKGAKMNLIISKALSELIKIGGTFLLFIYYNFTFKFQAAFMLVKFRMWVLRGILLNK